MVWKMKEKDTTIFGTNKQNKSDTLRNQKVVQGLVSDATTL